MAKFFTNATTNFGATKFLVGSLVNGAPYDLIQDAVDAAVATGVPQSIVIQPGTYAESIAWPAGLSVSSSSSSISDLKAIITGNQTFDSTGDLSFQDIAFSSSSGDTWTIGDAAVGTTNFDMINCAVQASAGFALSSSSTGGISNATFRNSIFFSTGASAVTHASGTMRANNTTFISSASDAVSVGLNGVFIAEESQLSGGGTFAGLLIADASVQTNTTVCTLNGQVGIRFSAGGAATSIRDAFSSIGTYAIDATGAFGTITIGLPLFPIGSTLIDPQITVIIIPSLAGASPGMPWSDITANQTLAVNHGYFVTAGSLLLALPATSSVGDVIEVSLTDTATAFSITQGAGQKIRVGSGVTTVGATGSLDSTAQGDSVRLVCYTADLEWQATPGTVGNLNAL